MVERERRRQLAVRLAEAGRVKLRARAAVETGGNESEMVRRLLVWAMSGAHKMPVGWEPKGGK